MFSLDAGVHLWTRFAMHVLQPLHMLQPYPGSHGIRIRCLHVKKSHACMEQPLLASGRCFMLCARSLEHSTPVTAAMVPTMVEDLFKVCPAGDCGCFFMFQYFFWLRKGHVACISA